MDQFGFREHAPPESPIWTSDSRIVRLSCPRHNEFATRADPLTPSEKASSRETGIWEETAGLQSIRLVIKTHYHSPRLRPSVLVSPRAAQGMPVYNAGAHLQPAKNTVAAVQRETDALALVITPNADKYFRVEVGPFVDTRSASNARHDLAANGSKSIVKR